MCRHRGPTNVPNPLVQTIRCQFWFIPNDADGFDVKYGFDSVVGDGLYLVPSQYAIGLSPRPLRPTSSPSSPLISVPMRFSPKYTLLSWLSIRVWL